MNGGSSRLKFAVFTAADPIECVLSGRVERVGLGGSRVIARVDRTLGRNEAGEPLISTDTSAT